jgi:ABC-type multidrug transport system fused ATPase/permease subunit
MNTDKNYNTIFKIFEILNKEQKKKLILNSCFSILISINEAFAVGLFVGYITLATKINEINKLELYIFLNKRFDNFNEIKFLIYIALVLILYFILRGLFNFIYIQRLSLFSERVYEYLATELIELYLKISYEDFGKRGLGFIQKVLVSETYNFTHVISSCLMFISELLLLIILCIFLISNNWKSTTFLIIFLSVSIFLIKNWTTKKIILLGSIREHTHKKYFEDINNIFRNFKYLKVSPHGPSFIKNVRENIQKYINANVRSSAISQIPRSLLEIIGYTAIIIVFAYLIVFNNGNIIEIIPTISLIAIGLSRMLPSVNRLVGAYNQINYHKSTIDLIHNELNLKKEVNFKSVKNFSIIDIKNLTVKIEEKIIFKNINLKIKRGKNIGILGESGAGKSTLIDVLMGLRGYAKGIITVDGKNSNPSKFDGFYGNVSYIPQEIYLSDITIQENISMGEGEDAEKIDQILTKVNLKNIFEERDGLNTMLGDGGMSISGGQAQRIAVARALYKDCEVIIMDEPTSSLDNLTSQKLMENIYDLTLNKTLIIVTHNPNILYKCDYIYEFIEGELKIIKKEND